MMWLSIELGAILRHGLTLAIPHHLRLDAMGNAGCERSGCSLMGICFALLQRDSISERIRGF